MPDSCLGLDRELAMLQQRYVELLLIAEGACFTPGVPTLGLGVNQPQEPCLPARRLGAR